MILLAKMSSPIILLVLCVSLALGNLSESGLKRMQKIFSDCSSKSEAVEVVKCFKFQGLKVMDRALHSKSINIVDGIALTVDSRQGRFLDTIPPINERSVASLKSEEIDDLLMDTTYKFLNSHKVQVNFPRLVEEGRQKPGGGGKYRGGWGALMAALAIKGVFLTMAYNGIAVMAGTAIIVGKMALLLSAILGLKKLVSSGSEKTTFEIVKVPKYSEAHTHSVSYEDNHHHRLYQLGPNHDKKFGQNGFSQ